MQRKPRVLQINKLYHPWVGGVERAVRDLAEGLQDGFDVEVLVCTHKGPGSEGRVAGVRVVRAGSIGMLMGMPIAPRFPFLLRRHSRSADILHFHFPFPIGALSYLLAGSRRPAIVVHYHSDLVRQRGFLTLYRWLVKMFLRRADRVFVTSPPLLDRSTVLQTVRDRCRVVPLSIDSRMLEENPSRRAASRQRLSISPDESVVLFVGRLAYYKGLEYLLAAMENVDARLLIVGDGPLRAELQTWIDRSGHRHRVEIVSGATDETVEGYYAAADLFVLPSVEPSEAFGIVQLEAMAHGLPVINTSLPTGVPWVSRDGESGLTVPPRDARALRRAIAILLGDPELRNRLGENARERARGFTSDKMLEQVKSEYRSLLAGQ